jgi:hypothetical protein
MAASQRRYTNEEFARRGDALVQSKVRPHLTPADEDKCVAIDVETGEYELDRNEMKAADRLRKRVPDPHIWLVHVTLGYLHRCGGHGSQGQPSSSGLSVHMNTVHGKQKIGGRAPGANLKVSPGYGLLLPMLERAGLARAPWPLLARRPARQ